MRALVCYAHLGSSGSITSFSPASYKRIFAFYRLSHLRQAVFHVDLLKGVTEMEKYPVIDVIATSKQIDALRKGKGLSVKDLQEVFGFSTPQAVYNWIWGTSLPSIDSLVVLAKLFDTKVDDILICR